MTSVDINEAFQEMVGADYTAKDLRTWAASVRCALALAAMPRWLVPSRF